MLAQVTRAVELVLALVLLAGISVLYAALTASRPVRAHESGLLRVFGAGSRMISRVQGAEYALLGFASGLMGAILAELTSAVLYIYLLDLTPRLHLGTMGFPSRWRGAIDRCHWACAFAGVASPSAGSQPRPTG